MRSGDNYREPPDLSGKKLDFSQFHPFDHSVFSHRCTELYGGRRNHLRGKWEYVWKHAVHAQTTCRIGMHYRSQVTKMREGKPHTVFVACLYCGKRLSDDQPV